MDKVEQVENKNDKIEELNNKTNIKENESTEVISNEDNNETASIIISKNTNKKKRMIILIASIIVILILSLLSVLFALLNIRNTKIMKGVFVENIDVSNLTKEEATILLQKVYNEKLQNQLLLQYGNYETSINYQSLDVKYQVENAVEQAYKIGRTGNIFVDNMQICNALINQTRIEPEIEIDKDIITQISQNINNNIEGTVKNPSYYIENNVLIITSGKEGIKVDESKLLQQIYNVLKEKQQEQKIQIPVITANPEQIDLGKIYNEVYKEAKDAYYTTNPFIIYPEVNGVNFDLESAKKMILEKKDEYHIPLIITKTTKTVKDLGTEAFPDKLGTFSTKYLASNVNRTTNLKLASNKINGTILLPGEEFSYNKVVGERTIQAGYKEAAVYSNGQVVDGLGGGICQISTTLYDAVIDANLEVTDRRNHQFVTSYVPAGLDATVVYGSQDFKFKNTRKHPIRITATVSGGIATISIWGIKEEVEYDVSIESRKVATIPFTTQYIEDPTLPVGQQVVVQEGNSGRKVEAYKVVKLNGKVISRTLLSKDTYNPMKKIVKVGTRQQQ